MRIKILDDDKIVLYLYNYFFKSNDKEVITQEIKKLFLKLIKYYKLNIGGIYEIIAFENKKYGTVLEVEKKEELVFHPDLIDVKIKINRNVDFYLKTKDYFLLQNNHNVYYDKGFYFINLKDLDNIIKVYEYGELIYNADIDYLKKKIFIK